MDLDAPATGENLDDLLKTEICEWAEKYLPFASAFAFSGWLHDEIDGWEASDITVGDVLTGAWQEWTGHEYPNPT